MPHQHFHLLWCKIFRSLFPVDFCKFLLKMRAGMNQMAEQPGSGRFCNMRKIKLSQLLDTAIRIIFLIFLMYLTVVL